jgi:hypothetical protein
MMMMIIIIIIYLYVPLAVEWLAQLRCFREVQS